MSSICECRAFDGAFYYNIVSTELDFKVEEDQQMSEQTVAERVIKVFANFKKVPPEEITMDTTFESLGLDSLDGLNLVFELEEEFDIMIPDDKVQMMKSVAEAVEGIEWLLANPVDNAAEMEKILKERAGIKDNEKADAPSTETEDSK